MTGDHGMPFPRCKANLYDCGSRVPLAIRWGAKVAKPGREVDDFVSLTDIAPTFLEAAGVAVPGEMTGRGVIDLLTSEKAGRIDPARDHVLTGKERHVPGQEGEDMGGYPCRAIRTHDYLYIRNFKPDRWPSGTPDFMKAAIRSAWLADCDNGPTKTYIDDNRDKDAAHRRAWDLSFAKRPAEELYDLRKDPEQLDNVAGDEPYAKVKQELAARLMSQLKATDDPRASGRGDEVFEVHPYLGSGPRHPSFRRE
jgi:arylsulfatase A-like enzyme